MEATLSGQTGYLFLVRPPALMTLRGNEENMKNLFMLFSLSFLLIPVVNAQSGPTDDEAAIKKPAFDYIEGWYAADAARMENALHPDLAKRIIYNDPKTGRSQLNHQSAMTLVQNTRKGGGSKTPKERQLKEITILDRFNNVAVVKIVASDWIDYLEEAKSVSPAPSALQKQIDEIKARLATSPVTASHQP